MTSRFFSNKNSFDEIVKNDPVKESWGQFWYLNEQLYEKYCWNSGIFTNDEIERIKTIGKRVGTIRAQTHGSGEDCLDHRRSFISWITPNQHTAWIYQRLTTILIENNEKYFNFDLNMIEVIQFTYYNSNEEGHYKAHTDAQMWNLPHNRKLSFVMQLSDPSEYEGGELLLHTAFEPTTIRKEKGLIACFPSYTLHEVTPVTKGERYSLVAWVHGPKLR
jgi:PKHD-type hydroxylase